MRNATWVMVSAVVIAGVIIASLLANTPSGPTGPPLEGQAALQLVAEGFAHPVAVATTDGVDDRFFVVDQIGVVRTVMTDGAVLPGPFLDLRAEMVALDPAYDERGLLSIAFHPDFGSNRLLYAFYSAPLREGAPEGYDHTNLVVELTAAEDLSSASPSENGTILAVDNPSRNHNGGQVLFGPDGYLYVTLGDGGGANDRGLGHNESIGNGQDLNSLHGKILRLDVDRGSGGTPYSVPPDNPFASGGGRPEIYAYGFRNPAYAAFDNETGELFVADAGQARFEEIDLVVRGGNYGWRIREGAHCFDPDNPLADPASCPTTGAGGEELIDPIGEFVNTDLPGGEGSAPVGGVLYRGNISELDGGYVFGAYRADGSPLFVLLPDGDGNWTRRTVLVEGRSDGRVPGYLLAVGLDVEGELLVLGADAAGPSGTSGKVWRLAAGNAPGGGADD